MSVLTVYTLSKKIPPLLVDKFDGIKLIYLFGSHVQGIATKASDIDIAVLAQQKIDSVVRWQVENALTNELASEIDLVDLLSASTVMQNQIIQKGICIYDPENKAALFEMQIMTMYQHLNEERADILKQYMEN